MGDQRKALYFPARWELSAMQAGLGTSAAKKLMQ